MSRPVRLDEPDPQLGAADRQPQTTGGPAAGAASAPGQHGWDDPVPLAVVDSVLVVDADPDLRAVLEITLSLAGFTVLEAADGATAVELALEHGPSLVLMDTAVPRLDGISALRALRADGRTSHIPVILTSARARGTDKVEGFESGADDYVTKPFDTDELLARVHATLRRAGEMRTVSPLTGLPGNARIRAELARRIETGEPFALLYADLNHFKALNDHYGFMRGDDTLRMLATVLSDVAHSLGRGRTFVGHVGGDDFVVVAPADRAEQIAQAICDRVDADVWQLYDPDDWRAGHIEVADRKGVIQRFAPVSVAIGIATSERRIFVHPSEPVAVATELKHYTKRTRGPGSAWSIDRRDAATPADLELDLPG